MGRAQVSWRPPACFWPPRSPAAPTGRRPIPRPARPSDFDLYESDTLEITSAPAGETTMWVQVHTFDHQPAGDPVEVNVIVEDGGSPGSDPADPGYGDGY